MFYNLGILMLLFCKVNRISASPEAARIYLNKVSIYLSMTGRVDKEQLQELKKMGLEALSLLTHVNYEINMQRKQLMKTDIGKDYATL